jgi:pimeloyl-ACP methyl ester carboxylesterase
VELYLDREAYPRVFAAGMPRPEAQAAAAAQRPITAAAFEEKSPAAAWKTVPSWYVIATEDQVLPAPDQRFMAQRAGTHATEIPASQAVA